LIQKTTVAAMQMAEKKVRAQRCCQAFASWIICWRPCDGGTSQGKAQITLIQAPGHHAEYDIFLVAIRSTGWR
jgi:hypothetical protein